MRTMNDNNQHKTDLQTTGHDRPKKRPVVRIQCSALYLNFFLLIYFLPINVAPPARKRKELTGSGMTSPSLKITVNYL